MGRANAIVVGSAVLAPLILGVEGYLLFRPHHRPRPAEMADVPAPSAPDSPAPPILVAPPPPTAIAAPQAPPPVAEPAPPPEEAPTDQAVLERRLALLQHQRDVVQTADEQVFDVLNLPDSQRTAIRAINAQYVRAFQPSSPSPSGTDSPDPGVDPSPLRTRRAAIANILGADGMRAFTFAERRAERHVRNQLRAQLLRGE